MSKCSPQAKFLATPLALTLRVSDDKKSSLLHIKRKKKKNYQRIVIPSLQVGEADPFDLLQKVVTVQKFSVEIRNRHHKFRCESYLKIKFPGR